jgi:RNA polymerase sigma-70 factor, ECF subfamily
VEVSAADPVRPAESLPGLELVGRIRAGDSKAEEELVQRYRRGVFVIVSHSVADRSVAEDLHQETFRITLEKIRRGDVREPEKLSGFVCSVARNLAIEHFRHCSVRSRTADLDTARGVFDPGPSPLQEILRRENSAIVRQVLDEVKPARYRGILYRLLSRRRRQRKDLCGSWNGEPAIQSRAAPGAGAIPGAVCTHG